MAFSTSQADNGILIFTANDMVSELEKVGTADRICMLFKSFPETDTGNLHSETKGEEEKKTTNV